MQEVYLSGTQSSKQWKHTHIRLPLQKCSWYLMHPFSEIFCSILYDIWRKQERENGLYKWMNMKSMLINYFNKMKRDSQFNNIKFSSKSEDSRTFFIFVMGSSLSHEINNIYLCYWKASNQVRSIVFILNTSDWRELQEVFKSRLTIMPMGFLCLVTWPAEALTGNHVYFVFNSNPWYLQRF